MSSGWRDGRTVLITGAGSGLGRDLCLHLADGGHRVIATDRDEQGLAETVRLLVTRGADRTGNPAEHRGIRVDVTDTAEIGRLVDAVAEVPPDVLINNAGLQHVAPLEEFPADRWNLLIDVMLNGAANMCRALLPAMRRSGWGRIVTIGSIHSLVASPFKTAYVAAKHGLVGLGRVLALETADTDITINTICPSYIRTPLVEAQITAQARIHGITEEDVIDKIMLEPMPKRAFIGADEVAGTVLFLMSSAARNITGQTLAIDGGWTVR